MSTSRPDVIPKFLPNGYRIKNHHGRVCWNRIVLKKQLFTDILQKLGVLKNLALFTEKHFCNLLPLTSGGR